MDDRDLLLKRLRATGCSEEQLERAASEGRLPTLTVEQALGGSNTHSLTSAARKSKLDPKFLRQLLQVLGRPAPAPRERNLSDDDIEIATLVRGFLDAGLPRKEVLEIGRVLSLGMSHTTEAVRRVVGDAMLRPGDSEFTLALRYAEAVDHLAPLVAPLLAAEFRAHLRSGIRNHLVTEAEREEGKLNGTREIAVAFADLVDYTRLGENLDPEDVGRIAGRLVEISVEEAEQPVTLVKTIGDAAMFVSPEVEPLVATVGALAKRVEDEGRGFPSVRVGLAYGPAVSRGGDWFGSTVNLASRIADVAKPGKVWATEEVQERAPKAEWKRKRRLRNLKGISDRVRLFALEAPPDTT